MKTTKYIILFLLIFTFQFGFSQEIIEKYLNTAAENNPGLKAVFNEYLAALEKAVQVNALPDPQVAFAYFIQPVETRNGPQQMKFSASQMFPWFGKLKSEENSMIQLAKARYEAFEEAKSKLFYQVKSKYYELYYLKRSIEINTENLQILQSFYQLISIKMETGKTGSVDILRMEMEMEELKEKMISLQENYDKNIIAFNLLLNIPVNSPVEINDHLDIRDTLLSKKQISDSVLANNHQIGSIEYQIDAIDFKKTAIRKSNYPSFSLGFEYISIGQTELAAPASGKDAFVFPKVGLSIPIYGKKNKSKVKEFELLQEAKVFEKENKQNTLLSQFESIWFEYNKSKRDIALYEKQKKTAQQALNILQTEFETDSKDFEEILRMQGKYLEYALKQFEAEVNLLNSIASIHYLSGN